MMLLIWAPVKKISVNQNAPTATDWHDGQFAHGRPARQARTRARPVCPPLSMARAE